MTEDLRPPYRIAFDNARDPYAARNALGLGPLGVGPPAPVGAQYITAATDATLTAERVLTNTATVTWDFATAGQAKANVAASYGDVFLAGNNTFTGNNYFAGTSKVHVIGHTAAVDSTLSLESHGGRLANYNWATSATLAGLNFRKSRGGGTPGTHGLVSAGDGTQINFAASDGASFLGYAAINGVTEGTPASGSMSGVIIFSTRLTTGANTERMRIDSAGLVTIAGNSTSANYPSGAWTAWTPTISASTGTITSTTINVARYTQHGKTITAFLDVTITNAGTGAGALMFTLPVTAAAVRTGAVGGRESAVVGYGLCGHVDVTSATIGVVFKYDGTTPITTTHRPVLTIVYEAA